MEHESPRNPPLAAVPNAAPDRAHWTPAKQRIFLHALLDTGSVVRAATAAGMTRSSAYRLRARLAGTVFDRTWTKALQAHAARLADRFGAPPVARASRRRREAVAPVMRHRRVDVAASSPACCVGVAPVSRCSRVPVASPFASDAFPPRLAQHGGSGSTFPTFGSRLSLLELDRQDRDRPPAGRSPAPARYAHGGVAATLAWALKDPLLGRALPALLGEVSWEAGPRHALFGRIEHVTKEEAGYAYRVPLAGPVGVALGGTVAAYVKPAALDRVYGDAPVSCTLFAKLALGL